MRFHSIVQLGLLEVGFSTSLRFRTSGGPYFVATIAFMGFLQV